MMIRMLESIDHVILPARDLDEAAAPFERLGLQLSPPATHKGAGTANRVFFVGNETNQFYVELLSVQHESAEVHPYLLEALGLEPALARVTFETADIAALAPYGDGPSYEVRRGDGSRIGVVQPLAAAAGFGAAAVQYDVPRKRRYAARKKRGLFDSRFHLKRMDHLAVMAPDLEATTRYWVDELGVPVFGEVSNDMLVIRQMKIGDAILELIGPASADSPVALRPPGLSSMVAFEVDDLDDAVRYARGRGFEVSHPESGILPGRRAASIDWDQLSGLTLQMLEYV